MAGDRPCCIWACRPAFGNASPTSATKPPSTGSADDRGRRPISVSYTHLASHSARTSMSRSRRCAGAAGRPRRITVVLAWLLPPDSAGSVCNGDNGVDVTRRLVDGSRRSYGAPRSLRELDPSATWECDHPPYGICSPVTNRRNASSSFRSRRTSLRLGRPSGPPERSSNRANHWACLLYTSS